MLKVHSSTKRVRTLVRKSRNTSVSEVFYRVVGHAMSRVIVISTIPQSLLNHHIARYGVSYLPRTDNPATKIEWELLRSQSVFAKHVALAARSATVPWNLLSIKCLMICVAPIQFSGSNTMSIFFMRVKFIHFEHRSASCILTNARSDAQAFGFDTCKRCNIYTPWRDVRPRTWHSPF